MQQQWPSPASSTSPTLLKMPQPSKKSAQVQSQCINGSTSFGTVKDTGSDTSSVYSPESEDDVSTPDGESNVGPLQTLYTNILSEHIKLNQMKLVLAKNGYKLTQSESKKQNRPIRYNGDSWTSAWQYQKKWQQAAKGSADISSYFYVSMHEFGSE